MLIYIVLKDKLADFVYMLNSAARGTNSQIIVKLTKIE